MTNTPPMVMVPNPAYESAQYEERYVGPKGVINAGPNIRGNTIVDGRIVDSVAPFIMVPESDLCPPVFDCLRPRTEHLPE